ncbi:TerB family tellurite resistance protein [Candidatus Albibeggiatoa sp. nov. BB20]|uniref:tellurite resistance TerB family protein n=1 Tax=Candidatus Albibeggiatoa sp. nov. BB20 TaxID=3162723 RepID=UPI0033654142
MGLFDMFSGDSSAEMTPHLAFATSLIYMMSADGHIENEEVGQLLSVLGGENQGGAIGVGANNRKLLERALKYAQSNAPEQFFTEIVPILSDAQKMCILTNILDSSLSDGSAASQEQELFAQFLKAFSVSEERFAPFFEVIALKNDRSVFTNPDHPRNSGEVKLQTK